MVSVFGMSSCQQVTIDYYIVYVSILSSSRKPSSEWIFFVGGVHLIIPFSMKWPPDSGKPRQGFS